MKPVEYDPFYNLIRATKTKYPWGTLPEFKQSSLTYETFINDTRKFINGENNRRYMEALRKVMNPRLIELCQKTKCMRPFETLGIKIVVITSPWIGITTTKRAILLQDNKPIHEFEVL